MTPTGPVARAGLVFAAVLAADQITKALVKSSLARGEERDVVGEVVKLVDVRNTGVAFGQLQHGGLIVSAVIALAVSALVVYFARHAARPWIWLPTGLLLGGALGNIVDRIFEGAVVDFIKLPHWPAFNVADSAITIGVVVLVIVMEFGHAARRPA
jgi:signal peptidase II